MNNDILWQKFMNNIEKEVAPVSFNTWFKTIKLHDIDIDSIKIEVPINYNRKHLEKNYNELVEEIFLELTGKNYNIEFISEEELEQEKNFFEEEKNIITNNDADNINSNLNPNYLFENFMIGESNKFAYSSALTVAQNPGNLYNPLFIHGKSGLGKTHLMHAIGNYIVKNTHLKVLYVTSDQFREEFVDMNIIDPKQINNNLEYMNAFKNKYRNIDVLIIDDIQFFSGAEKTRQEFFHTFEYLKNSNKQIIISSDRSPDDLKFLEDRLKTRFSWGLTVNIFPPEFALKIKIIKDKIKVYDIAKYIEDEVIEYIANNSENDVRHLEGSITRLIAYSAMMNQKDINLDFAIEALQDFMKKNHYLKSNISKIQKAVADYYGITVEDIKGKKRNAEINYPRQIAIYLSRMLTDETTTKIGIEFGGKSHSTVIHSHNKITEDLKNNPELNKMINEIKSKIS